MASITIGKYPYGHEILINQDYNQYKYRDKFTLHSPTKIVNETIRVSKNLTAEVFLVDKDDRIIQIVGTKTKIHSMFTHNQRRGGMNRGNLFESELASDLRGETNHHPITVEKIKAIISNKPFVVHETGSANSRRPLNLDDNGLYLLDRDGSKHGDMLADLVLNFSDHSTENLSLKTSNSYSVMNCGIMKYLKDEVDRRNLLAALGIDYIRFEEDFNFNSEFDYEPHLNESPVKMIEDLVDSAFGTNYILVHKIDNERIIVERMPEQNDIRITDIEYHYRSDKNKYFRMKMNINVNGHEYKGNLQMRNVKGEIVPHVLSFYLRK